jgi:alpha-glucosidase
LVLAALAVLPVGLSARDASGQTWPVRESRPPIRDFYDKHVDCGGLVVRSARIVDDRALELACGKVTTMLAHAPQAKANLLEWRVELHIIGRNQQPSDLPELHWARGKDWDKSTHQDVDQRTRGVGGLYASCGEENLLGLPSDRYRGGSDICVHEFAHTVMEFGLDDALRSGIADQYRRATSAGRWNGLYAATSPNEYWAELSMWYFGAHGQRGTTGPADGGAALAAYDPDGDALLDDIYSGRRIPSAVKISPVHVVTGTGELRSLAGGAGASLVLRNNSSRTFWLQWLDFKGQPVTYGRLEQMSDRTIRTYVRHAWELKDAVSGQIVRFVVEAPFSRWSVGE